MPFALRVDMVRSSGSSPVWYATKSESARPLSSQETVKSPTCPAGVDLGDEALVRCFPREGLKHAFCHGRAADIAHAAKKNRYLVGHACVGDQNASLGRDLGLDFAQESRSPPTGPEADHVIPRRLSRSPSACEGCRPICRRDVSLFVVKATFTPVLASCSDPARRRD